MWLMAERARCGGGLTCQDGQRVVAGAAVAVEHAPRLRAALRLRPIAQGEAGAWGQENP